MPLDSFLAFRLVVLTDPQLQEQFRSAPDRESLFQLVLATGRERGFDFSEQDLLHVVQVNRRMWLERWVFQ